MQILTRLVAIAYLAFLTSLLLVSDPLQMVAARPVFLPWFLWLLSWAHLISFAMLAVLMLIAHWPIPRWCLALLLVLYAGGTEIAQSFTPARTAEWGDWLQDLGGVAIGIGICWGATVFLARRAKSKGGLKAAKPSKSEIVWDAAHGLLQRSRSQRESWWK